MVGQYMGVGFGGAPIPVHCWVGGEFDSPAEKCQCCGDTVVEPGKPAPEETTVAACQAAEGPPPEDPEG